MLEIQRHSFKAMASNCEFILGNLSAAEAKPLFLAAQDEVERIEKKYSRYREDSFLSQINNHPRGEPVCCDEETVSLLDKADLLYRASDGLFDVTSGVLRRVWDFKQAKLPNAEALEQVLELIDWRAVQRQGNNVALLKDGMELDFGGFGKEYAADRAAAVLLEAGANSGYVNLAGDFHILGPKPDRQPWSIGIRNPRQTDEVFASIPIDSGALATSGDYERYFEFEGKRYCHILNARSGYPVSYWRSISVLAPTTLMAGGFSTIAMLLEEKGLEFLEQCGFPFIAIDHQGQVMHKSDSRTA